MSLFTLGLDDVFKDRLSGQTGKVYERKIADLPKDFMLAGGFSIDADGQTAYFGFDQTKAPPRPKGEPVPQVPGGLLSMDLKTGQTKIIVKTPFRIGHIQANPFKSGQILLCHETGGDAPQRMWIAEASEASLRPLYVEGPIDWVTHEQFADVDHVIFNLLGHTKSLRQRPSGVMTVNITDGRVESLGQVASFDPTLSVTRPAPNSYWHNGVTFDGRFAAADDFNGSVWLIDRQSGAQILLTTGHFMRPDHAHPSFSPDAKSILIQSGMLSQGNSLGLMLIALD